jgi:uncharacterized ferredoxin-like protein
MDGVQNSEHLITKGIMATAARMVIAATTAPKGKGVNHLHALVVSGEVIQRLAAHMIEIGNRTSQPFFIRDAENLKVSTALVLLGSDIGALNLKYCGWCGMENCAGRLASPEVPCAFNAIDLGIATGSAVSVAMDDRVDNRVMYTAGIAAIEIGLFGPEVKLALGIPLSGTHKNIYFDRPAV